MRMTDFIIQNLADERFEKIRETRDYQTAWEQRNAAERELVEALTRKQRRLFYEYVKKQDDLTAVELSHLLAGCTLVFSVTPRSQSPHN